MEKTHYRKAFNSPYLSSADIVGPTNLTIAKVALENDKTKKTKDQFNTAFFVEAEIRPGEKLKPMILNAQNSKMLSDISGAAFIEDWKNIPVTIYVDKNVRFGRDTVEGLRIMKQAPAKVKPALLIDTPQFNNAVTAYKRDGNLDAVLQHMTVTDEVAAAIKAVA